MDSPDQKTKVANAFSLRSLAGAQETPKRFAPKLKAKGQKKGVGEHGLLFSGTTFTAQGACYNEKRRKEKGVKLAE